MDTVFTIGIFLSFFLQFLLLSKKKATTSDRILAIWMFVFGLHLFSYYLHSLGYWETYPHLSGIHHPFPLLHGPFLYLYVLFSVRSEQRFRWRNYLHFAPAALFYLYMLPFLFFYTEEQKLMVNHGIVDDYSAFITFSLFPFIISGITYVALSYRLLKRYDNLTQQNFAYKKSIDLNWLKHFIIGLGVIFGLAFILAVLQEWVGLQFGFNTDIVFYSLIILFIFYLGYSGIIHQGIFSSADSTVQLVEPKKRGEYKNSGLKEEEALEYHNELISLMKSKKPYLEPKLSLVTLAEYLDMSPNHLSQIINQCERKNFFDFVNSYRVEEYKERAVNPAYQNFSILAIALDSGFNSKSSFNQVFKKLTGKTPSQYLSEV